MTTDLVIGIDSSTSATKAIAWDGEGRAIAEGRAPIAMSNPAAGQFEQFLQGKFAPLFHDVPDFTLTFRQLRQIAGKRQDAHKKSFAPAGFLFANGFRQNAFQSDLRRAAIVIGNPAREF